MSSEHFRLILDALEVGLDGVTEQPNFAFKSVTNEMPTLIEGLQPPVAVRAIVNIDDTAYEVVIRPSQGHGAYPAEGEQG